MVFTPSKLEDNSPGIVDLHGRMKHKYTRRCGLADLSLDMSSLSLSNDMSGGSDVRRQTEAERDVNRLRNCMPEKLTTFVKMHLSFLLELDGSKLEEMFLEPVYDTDTPVQKKKTSTPFSIKKKDRSSTVETSAALTKEQVAQMCQLIKVLKKPENMKIVGLFRKTGNVVRQRVLKQWLTEDVKGGDTDQTFSPHDAATVLKQLLADLPEPLLIHKHCEAYLQIVGMGENRSTQKEKEFARSKQLKALQLMVLLLPRENAILLNRLLDLMHQVAGIADNKMTTKALGVVFGPSLLCHRKMLNLMKTISKEPDQTVSYLLSDMWSHWLQMTSMKILNKWKGATEMQRMSDQFGNAIAVMIENYPELFTIPEALAADIANFWHEMENPNIKAFNDNGGDKENRDSTGGGMQKAKYGSSSAVNTVLTFVERKSPEEYSTADDTQVALAGLYAHIQSMPESAKKRKLLKQFNRSSGLHAASTSKKGKHVRSRSFGESLKKHFPILMKQKQRDLCEPEDCNTSRLTWSITKPISIEDTTPSSTPSLSSYTKISTANSTLEHSSPSVHIVDLGTSPCNVKCRKRLSDETIDSQTCDPKLRHRDTENDCARCPTPCKKLFPMTPITPCSRITPVAMVSPISKSVRKLPESSKKAVMTPRSRIPLYLLSPNSSFKESAC